MATDAPGIQQQLATDSMLPDIPFRGRSYKIGRPDGEAKGRLEKLVKKVAIDTVRELRDTLDTAAYQESFREVTTNLKRYDTWRDGWRDIVFDPANAHLFLWSLLQAKYPDISERDVKALASESPEEVQLAMAQVIPDFFRVTLAGMNLTPDQRQTMEAAIAQAAAALVPRTPETPTHNGSSASAPPM